MSSADLFIENFYNLDGVSLAERRRNFYKLLDANSDLKSNPVIVDEIVGKLKPRTFLEELFRLDLLLYYRHIQELYNILKDGNEIFVSKIVKHQWFFEEIFKDIDAEQLINDILPTTSYAVRMKILKKLSQLLQGERFDGIYDGLNQRYGQFFANQFFMGCSDRKMEELLQNHQQISLNINQIMILYKRNRELVFKYFKNYRSNLYDYLKFFNHLFVNDHEFYQKLYSEFGISTRLGKRLTRRIVYSRKNHMIQSPDLYENRVNLRTTMRKLRSDSKIFLNNVVEKHRQSNNIYEIFNWIQIFPKKYQWKLFKEFIMSRYSIEQYLHLIDERFIEIIDNVDDRQLIIERKILDGKQNFIKFLNVNESIPMLKEKINLTSSIADRTRFVNQLIETCYFHNDINTLTNIVKYFSIKHRNDDKYLQFDFLKTIKQTFSYHKLNENIWKSLLEIFEIHKLKFDHEPSLDDQLSYLEFLFNRNQIINDELLTLLKSTEYYRIDCSIMQHNPIFWKYLLEFIIDNAPLIVEEKKLRLFDIHIIEQINIWNEKNLNNQLSMFNYPRIVDNCKAFLNENYSYKLNSMLVKMVRNKSSVQRDEFLKFFWRDISRYGSLNILLWLLRHDIEKVQKNFDQLTKWCLNYNKDNKLLYKLKKHSHLQFDKDMIEFSLKHLDDENSIRCLSVLMSGERFQQFADEYSQIVSKKLDLNDANEVKLYQIRCSIAKFYKYTKYPKAINSLYKYCIGDYLGSALTSLYSFMYHLPENQLEPILNEINATKAVSFRKHALFLACELTDYSTIKRIITILNQTENVQSIQKRLIKTTIGYLKKNPTEQIFELVKLNIKYTNKNDDDLLEDLVDIHIIPKQFVAKYFEFIWDYLDFIDDRPARYRQLKEDTLRRLHSNIIEELPIEFCQKIIDRHFLKTDVLTKSAIDDFIMKLFWCKNKQLLILEQIIKILDESETDDNKQTFISFYYYAYMRSDSMEFLQLVVNYWEKFIDPVQHFPDYVKIFFLKLKISQMPTIDIDTTIEGIIEFFNELIEKYSQFIVYNFANLVNECIRYFTDDRYDFYEKLLLKYYNNINVIMLVLLWLPEHCPRRNLEQHQRILKKIQIVENPGVQINLKLKFKNTNCNNDNADLMETD